MSSGNPDITTPTPPGGYSANVRIELRVNGTRFRVAKVGPERLYLDAPQALSPSTAELVMHIDGHERRWSVTLRPDAQPSRIVPAEFEPV